MSAPWEVFIDEDRRHIYVRDENPCTLDTRYLRADLTCGECGMHQARCRHPWEGPRGYNCKPHDNAPACMAFQPRTERIECGEE